MSNLPEVRKEYNLAGIESALVTNDLSKMSTEERINYVKAICDSVGLNHLTNPFAYIKLNGALTLYAKKDASEQLRKIHGVSTQILKMGAEDGLFSVHIKAKDKTGKEDEDVALVNINGLKGEALANAKMKCVTKAKRRVTLSICGLGMLDESELDTMREVTSIAPNPQVVNPFDELRQEAPEEEDVQEFTESEVEKCLDDYVCRVGNKYNGKKLSEIDPTELGKYCDWMKSNSEQKGFEIQGDWLEFYQNAQEYLQSLLN